MWRQSVEEIQCLVREQLWKQREMGQGGMEVGAVVRKVQLGRVENGNRSCDCWELCSQLLGIQPCSRFHSRYPSEIWTCSWVTSGSPVVSVSQLPNPSHLSQWCLSTTLPLATLLTVAPWQCAIPWLRVDKSVFKMWVTAQECWMYSWGRNRI